MRRFGTWVLSVLILASAAPTHGQEELDDPFSEHAAEPSEPSHIAQIGVLVEFIQVDAAVAAKMVRQHAAATDAGELRHALQKLIEAGEAEEIDSSYVVSLPGQRAKVESVSEFIYPTEYDVSRTFEGLQPLDGTADLSTGFPVFPGIPSAYDVRNVGTILELEPNWTPGQSIIEINLVPERVDFVKFIRYGDDPDNQLSWQPVFSVIKLQTNINVPDGSYALLSVQVPGAESDSDDDRGVQPDPTKRTLIFLKADVLKVPLGDAKQTDQNDPAPN